EQEEVRRRVDAAERAVELDRRHRSRPLRTLRQDDLECIAVVDVLLRPPYPRLVHGLRRKATRPSGPYPGARHGDRSGRAVEELGGLGGIAVQDLGDAERVVEAE